MSQYFKYEYPLDPDCPGAQKLEEDLDDPYMAMSGCAGEFRDDWEAAHQSKCKRCQEYGASNIGVVEK